MHDITLRHIYNLMSYKCQKLNQCKLLFTTLLPANGGTIRQASSVPRHFCALEFITRILKGESHNWYFVVVSDCKLMMSASHMGDGLSTIDPPESTITVLQLNC